MLLDDLYSEVVMEFMTAEPVRYEAGNWYRSGFQGFINRRVERLTDDELKQLVVELIDVGFEFTPTNLNRRDSKRLLIEAVREFVAQELRNREFDDEAIDAEMNRRLKLLEDMRGKHPVRP